MDRRTHADFAMRLDTRLHYTLLCSKIQFATMAGDSSSRSAIVMAQQPAEESLASDPTDRRLGLEFLR